MTRKNGYYWVKLKKYTGNAVGGDKFIAYYAAHLMLTNNVMPPTNKSFILGYWYFNNQVYQDIDLVVLSEKLECPEESKLTNKEYVDLVNSGNYPNDIQVPLDKPFVDDRGIIQNIWLGSSASITYIESKKGSIRAQHTHTVESGDFHSIFIISGSLKYTEGKNSESKEYLFKAGESFFTRPGVYHKVEFLEDTKFITINGIVKNHENYEKSIVRE